MPRVITGMDNATEQMRNAMETALQYRRGMGRGDPYQVRTMQRPELNVMRTIIRQNERDTQLSFVDVDRNGQVINTGTGEDSITYRYRRIQGWVNRETYSTYFEDVIRVETMYDPERRQYDERGNPINGEEQAHTTTANTDEWVAAAPVQEPTFEEQIKKLAQTVKSQHSSSINSAKNNIAGIEARIESYRNGLHNDYRSLFAKQRELEGLTNAIEAMEDKILKEFTSMKEKERIVTDIKFNNGTLDIYTDTIYINHADKKYLIGKFNIRILLNNGNKILLLNTQPENRRKSVWSTQDNHPHVKHSGEPCWGNVLTSIVELLAQNEFRGALSLIVGYLQSVNIDDSAGKYIVNWDIVDENGNVIPRDGGARDAEGHDTSVCSQCGYEFEVDEDGELEDYRYQCNRCHTYICEDCRMESGIGDTYCGDCYDTIFGECHNCGSEVRRRDGRTFDGEIYCIDCFNENFHTCDNCGQIHHNDDMHYVDRVDKWFCLDCRDELHWERCSRCDNWMNHDEDEIFNDDYGNPICETCHEAIEDEEDAENEEREEAMDFYDPFEEPQAIQPIAQRTTRLETVPLTEYVDQDTAQNIRDLVAQGAITQEEADRQLANIITGGATTGRTRGGG